MVGHPLVHLELDRVLRDSSSNGSENFNNQDDCDVPWTPDWVSLMTSVAIALGGFLFVLYLVLAVHHVKVLVSNFPFLNSFLLASLVNVLSGGSYNLLSSRCWYESRFLCKVIPPLMDSSDTAMTLFIVAMILEQNHPYVYSFLAKNARFRKRLTVTVLWLVTVVLSIPQIIIWDILSLFGNLVICTVPKSHHADIHFHKGLFLEYLVPLLLLIVTLTHAVVLWRRRSNIALTEASQEPVESVTGDGENDCREETSSNSPPLRVTSVVLGVVFFMMKTPFYLALFMYVFFSLYPPFMFHVSHILYPIPSIVSPLLVLINSPTHKKRLKETYQTIASCIAGRTVRAGFTLRTEDEEKL